MLFSVIHVSNHDLLEPLNNHFSTVGDNRFTAMTIEEMMGLDHILLVKGMPDYYFQLLLVNSETINFFVAILFFLQFLVVQIVK